MPVAGAGLVCAAQDTVLRRGDQPSGSRERAIDQRVDAKIEITRIVIALRPRMMAIADRVVVLEWRLHGRAQRSEPGNDNDEPGELDERLTVAVTH